MPMMAMVDGDRDPEGQPHELRVVRPTQMKAPSIMKSPWAKFTAFGGLVDEHEAHGDEAVDTAIGQAADKQLQHVQDAISSLMVRGLGRAPRSFLFAAGDLLAVPRKAPLTGAMNTFPSGFCSSTGNRSIRLGQRHDRGDVGLPAYVGKALLRFHDDAGLTLVGRPPASHSLSQKPSMCLCHEDELAGLRDDRLARIHAAIDHPAPAPAPHGVEHRAAELAGHGVEKESRLLLLQDVFSGKPHLEIGRGDVEHMGKPPAAASWPSSSAPDQRDRPKALVPGRTHDELAELAGAGRKHEGLRALLAHQVSNMASAVSGLTIEGRRVFVAHLVDDRNGRACIRDGVFGPATRAGTCRWRRQRVYRSCLAMPCRVRRPRTSPTPSKPGGRPIWRGCP